MKAASLLLSICIVCSSCCPNYSQGSRVGTITKFSKKGFFWKSWEGELVMGGLRQSSTDNGDTVATAVVIGVKVLELTNWSVANEKAAPSQKDYLGNCRVPPSYSRE